MPHYKVELVSIDSLDDLRNTEFSVTIEAPNGDDAIVTAKDLLRASCTDEHPSKLWSWSFYETSEK
jgi:hypothetical protein